MREVTAGEFTAESLETEAAKMPPSKKAEADILRSAAKIYREIVGKRKIRVWEEGEWDKKGAAFIKADPAHSPAVQRSDSGRARDEAAREAETKRTLDDYGKKVGS
jgi:hypothetical protein